MLRRCHNSCSERQTHRLIVCALAPLQVSMVISKIFLKTQYKLSQYFGALVVAGGLAIVLVPVFVDPPKVCSCASPSMRSCL